jgi:alanyl-tRNA synthetase
MTQKEIERVEDLANDRVLENSRVTTRLMGIEDARESGARALFGEKYGDEVRVVIMGEGVGNQLGWSVELCGGTHVRRTGDIGLISVVSDAGVAAGVRRLEALTGTNARKVANHTIQLAKSAAAEIKAPLEDMPARIVQILDERRKLERELSDVKKKLVTGAGSAAGTSNANAVGYGFKTVGDIKLIAQTIPDVEIKNLKSYADEFKKSLGSGVVALVGLSEDGKASIVVGVTNDLTARFNAVDLVKKGAEALGGKGGGGRPDMAQAGGPDGAKADAALAAVEAALSA